MMSSGTNDRINELLQNYVDKSITREQHAELFRYINNPEAKVQVFNFMDEYQRNIKIYTSAREIDWNRMYEKITEQKLGKTKGLPIWKLSAVAAILI